MNPAPGTVYGTSTRKKFKMKNKLIDLNNHLFAQIERLTDENATPEIIKQEIARSSALASLSANVIANAKIVLDAHVAAKEWGLDKMLDQVGASTIRSAQIT
jgi:hypothetical protein